MTASNPRTGLNWAGLAIVNALTLMLAFCLWALVTREVPAANKEAFLILIGVLARDFGTVVGWFFGGSLTNKQQTDIMEKQTDTIKEAQSALAPLNPVPTVQLEPGETATVKAEPAP
jgi:hypothetical protein